MPRKKRESKDSEDSVRKRQRVNLEDRDEDEILWVDDSEEEEPSRPVALSPREARRRDRKSQSNVMTEEEMLALAMRMSAQEANIDARRQEEEDEAMRQAIQESLCADPTSSQPDESLLEVENPALPCAPSSQSQGHSLALPFKRKLSYPNPGVVGREAGQVQGGGVSSVEAEPGGGDEKRRRGRSPELSQTQRVSSQTLFSSASPSTPPSTPPSVTRLRPSQEEGSSIRVLDELSASDWSPDRASPSHGSPVFPLTSTAKSCATRLLRPQDQALRLPSAQHQALRLPPAQHQALRLRPAQHQALRLPPAQHQALRLPPAQHQALRLPPAQKQDLLADCRASAFAPLGESQGSSPRTPETSQPKSPIHPGSPLSCPEPSRAQSPVFPRGAHTRGGTTLARTSRAATPETPDRPRSPVFPRADPIKEQGPLSSTMPLSPPAANESGDEEHAQTCQSERGPVSSQMSSQSSQSSQRSGPSKGSLSLKRRRGGTCQPGDQGKPVVEPEKRRQEECTADENKEAVDSQETCALESQLLQEFSCDMVLRMSSEEEEEVSPSPVFPQETFVPRPDSQTGPTSTNHHPVPSHHTLSPSPHHRPAPSSHHSLSPIPHHRPAPPSHHSLSPSPDGPSTPKPPRRKFTYQGMYAAEPAPSPSQDPDSQEKSKAPRPQGEGRAAAHLQGQGPSCQISPSTEKLGAQGTVHYYWGVPFCPRGQEPDTYTRVILAQLEVYEKTLKEAQRSLLRKAEWGPPLLPAPLEKPSLRSQRLLRRGRTAPLPDEEEEDEEDGERGGRKEEQEEGEVVEVEEQEEGGVVKEGGGCEKKEKERRRSERLWKDSEELMISSPELTEEKPRSPEFQRSTRLLPPRRRLGLRRSEQRSDLPQEGNTQPSQEEEEDNTQLYLEEEKEEEKCTHPPQEEETGSEVEGRKNGEEEEGRRNGEEEEGQRNGEEEGQRNGEEEEGMGEEELDIGDCDGVCPETQLSDDDITQDLMVTSPEQPRANSQRLPQILTFLPGRPEEEEEGMEVDGREGCSPVCSLTGGQDVGMEEEEESGEVVEVQVDVQTPPSSSAGAGVECPLCMRPFPLEDIEMHAAYCDGTSGGAMEQEEEQDSQQVQVRPRRKRTRLGEIIGEDPSSSSGSTSNHAAGPEREKCFLCKRVFPVAEYHRHVDDCIKRRSTPGQTRNLLSALEQTESRDPGTCETGPCDSTFRTNQSLLDQQDPYEFGGERGGEAGGGEGGEGSGGDLCRPGIKGGASPIRSFTAISEATDCLIDFKHQYNTTKLSQRGQRRGGARGRRRFK